MKVLYDDVKNQIKNAKIGSTVEVLVANGTRRNGSSPYYHRKGKLIDKTETSIKVLIGEKKYEMTLCHGRDWVGEYPNMTRVKNEYADGLYSVTMVAE